MQSTLLLHGAVRSCPGRILLTLIGVAVIRASLFYGVAKGFETWQAMPDPPEEAFNDGGATIGALFIGWLPASIMVGFVALVSSLVTRRRRG